MNRILSIVLLLLIFVSCNLFYQKDSAHGETKTGVMKLLKAERDKSAPFIQTSGTFKVLFIMCKFKDDNFDISPNTDPWPASHKGMPGFAKTIVSPVVKSEYDDPSLSGYFHDMSLGKYNMIGDVIFYEPDSIQSKYYPSNNSHIGYLSEEILKGIDESVNYADYDNDNDGDVDMIFICFRFANTKDLDPNFMKKYNGIASLTGYSNFVSGNKLILDGMEIKGGPLGSGVFSEDCISIHNIMNVILHEFGHYLFGSIHYEGVGYHGIMDGSGSGVMHSFEREKLGWIDPIVVDANLTDVTIPDVISTSVVYKIPVKENNEYYLVENHQRINYYENSFLTHNGGTLRSPGTGLLISHIHYNSIDIESAFGRRQWKKENRNYVIPFKTNFQDAAFGEDKLDLRQRRTQKGKQNHPDQLGSQSDFFTEDYNNVFSPWSNPSTGNSNIAVELLYKDENNNIHVNFYLDSPEDAVPSKPRNLRITIENDYPKLIWDANNEPDIEGYYVFRKVNKGDWKEIFFAISNSFTDSTINTQENNLVIEYKINAIDTQKKTSIFSETVSLN